MPSDLPPARPRRTVAQQIAAWQRTPAGRKHAARTAQARGQALELRAHEHFTALGFLVFIIATPKRMVRGKLLHARKVAGDIMGADPTGRAVLIECKRRQARDADEALAGLCRPPVASDFEDHQRTTLLQWEARGGLALIVWLSENGRDLRTSLPSEVFGGQEPAWHPPLVHPTAHPALDRARRASQRAH